MARFAVPWADSMSVALTLAVLTLVVLAGCGTPLASSQRYPPGVAEHGVENASVLASAQHEQLSQGYREHTVTTYRANNGTVVQRIESTQRWSPDAANRTISFKIPHGALGTHAEIYRSGNETLVQVTTVAGDLTMKHSASLGDRPLIPGPNTSRATVLALASASNNSTTHFDNGTTRIRFNDTQFAGGTAHGYLDVKPSGLVEQYEVTYTASILGIPITVHRETEYSHIGSPDVTRPQWAGNTTSTG